MNGMGMVDYMKIRCATIDPCVTRLGVDPAPLAAGGSFFVGGAAVARELAGAAVGAVADVLDRASHPPSTSCRRAIFRG